MKRASLKPLPVGYPVYHAISQLNRSFEESIQAVEHVMSFNLFPPDELKAYQVMLEEIRALANQDFVEIVGDRELGNSAYYESLRLKWQGRFKQDKKELIAKRSQPARQRGKTVRP